MLSLRRFTGKLIRHQRLGVHGRVFTVCTTMQYKMYTYCTYYCIHQFFIHLPNSLPKPRSVHTLTENSTHFYFTKCPPDPNLRSHSPAPRLSNFQSLSHLFTLHNAGIRCEGLVERDWETSTKHRTNLPTTSSELKDIDRCIGLLCGSTPPPI